MVQKTVLLLFVVSLGSANILPSSFIEQILNSPQPPYNFLESLVAQSQIIPSVRSLPAPPQEPTQDPCTAHLRTGAKKTVVKFFNSKEVSNDTAIWNEVKTYFSDFVTIAFVDVDVSVCPGLLEDFDQKVLPAYGMLTDDVLLALCNAPTTFDQMKNYFFDFTFKRYKKMKNFTKYSGELCNISYPRKKGEIIDKFNHDEKVKQGPSFVLYQVDECRYCKQFTGLWNAAYDANHNIINFYHIECALARGFCAERNAFGWPTIYFYDKDKKIEYTGNENITEINNFLRLHSPTVQLTTLT